MLLRLVVDEGLEVEGAHLEVGEKARSKWTSSGRASPRGACVC